MGIGAGTSIISAALPEATAREIYKPRVVTGGAQAPNGRAVPVDGGYRVSGRWGFASGCTHCSWLVGGTLVMDGDAPRMIDGFPDLRTMVFPVSEVEIIDTWNVSGLRGTGSRDMQVKDVFVPEERAVSFLAGGKLHVDGPTYRFPVLGFLALTIASIPLGMARRAIDELLELAGSKTPMGSANKLRDRGVVQYEIAQAEAKLRSARAWLYEVTDAMWDRVVRGDEVTHARPGGVAVGLRARGDRVGARGGHGVHARRRHIDLRDERAAALHARHARGDAAHHAGAGELRGGGAADAGVGAGVADGVRSGRSSSQFTVSGELVGSRTDRITAGDGCATCFASPDCQSDCG